MMRLLCLLLTLCGSLHAAAQVLTWTPPFPKENDPSQSLVITMDATAGNRGLMGHSATDVYLHIGVITSLSTNASDWKYVKTTWATTPPAYRATSIGANKWQFTIPGSLRTYFGITNAAETIRHIALLFRSGDGNKKQTNRDGSDMYIPVASGLAVRITEPASEPRFDPVPDPQTWTVGTSFNFSAASSEAARIRLYHNGTLLKTEEGVTTSTATATVTAAGNQQLVAEAVSGGTTRSDTFNIFVAPQNLPVAELPAGVRDGINYESGGTAVTLVLLAPGKRIATVLGDFNNWTEGANYVMTKTPDGKRFWLRLTGLTPGQEYGFQYQVDDTIRIADPYAQKVLDPWNDQFIPAATYPNLKPYPTGKTTGIVSVLQPAAPAYTWSAPAFNRPDARGLVIYELLLRDFLAAHDWKTLRDTLGYLQRLGINAIELLPFNEFEGNISWGYNPDFYFAPDKYYGTANNLKEFIDSAHRRGIAVIMDIALNHSFGLSPMVQLYFDNAAGRPSANSPWYNPVPKHPFNVGYDFNHESLDTRAFTSRVVEHWLQEYRIDGFRFDLSKGFTQMNSGDNVAQWGQYDPSRIAIWKRYNDTVQSKAPGAYVILEHFADNAEEKELAADGMLLWGNMNHAYTEAAMGYTDNNNSDLSGVLHSTRTWAEPRLIGYMESHDEERMVYKNLQFGNSNATYNTKVLDTALRRAALSTAFFLTLPGPKMIWQFGELGYDFPINYCENGTINNDCRTAPKPIRWDYLNDPRRRRLFDVYSKLNALRASPEYRSLFLSSVPETSLNGVFKTIKLTGGDTSQMVVVGNFGMTPQTGTVTFPKGGTWYNYLDGGTFTATGGAQNITLQPGEYRVLLSRNLGTTTPTPVTSLPWTGTALEVKLFPNPARGEYFVEVYLPAASAVRAELFTAEGRHAATLHSGSLGRGRHRISADRGALPAGTYFLRVSTKGGTRTLTLTLQ